MVDRVTGKTVMLYQEVVYDNLPSYCTYCKHQGHREKSGRVMKSQVAEEMDKTGAPVESNLPIVDVSMTDQLKGDAMDYLNALRIEQRGKKKE